MFLINLFLLFITTTAFSLPNDVKICRFDDHDCLLASANYVLKHFSNGNPDLALEPIDPLNIDAMTVDQNSGPVKILVKLNNFDILGFSGAEIYKLSGFENDLIDLHMKLPFATLAGPYNINGDILILPVNGVGKMRLHFKNFDIKMKLPVVKEIRDGNFFMKIENPEMTFDITGGDVSFSHLGSFANGFLNSNFNRIISLIKPAISKSLVEKLTHRINSVFSTMSYNELFAA
ncbi:hypothetical protein ACKWTF_007854 [Chironomus riparius]